jgi:hypothetical protein
MHLYSQPLEVYHCGLLMSCRNALLEDYSGGLWRFATYQ